MGECWRTLNQSAKEMVMGEGKLELMLDYATAPSEACRRAQAQQNDGYKPPARPKRGRKKRPSKVAPLTGTKAKPAVNPTTPSNKKRSHFGSTNGDSWKKSARTRSSAQ